MKGERTYKELRTGKSFGTNIFAMLRFSHNNPDVEFESYDPASKQITRQRILSTIKEQSLKSETHWTVTSNIVRHDVEPYVKIVEIRKEDWK